MRQKNVLDERFRQESPRNDDGYRGTRFPDHESGYGSELVRLNFVPSRASGVEVDSRRRLVRVMPALVPVDLKPVGVRRRRESANAEVITIKNATVLPAKRSTGRATLRLRLVAVA